jgi:hypothetical protein
MFRGQKKFSRKENTMETKVALMNGTVLDLATWDFPDLTVFALMTTEYELLQAITAVQEYMTNLIAAVREGYLPEQCFIPDLWHHREEFAHEEGLDLFEQVMIGCQIAKHYYDTYEKIVRNGVGGWLFPARNPDDPDINPDVPRIIFPSR